MARENLTLLHGQVRTVPKIYVNDKGEEIRAMLCLKVLRRPTNNQGFDSKLYIDCPIIRTKSPEMISKIRELKINDMIDVRGVVTSKEVKKKSICPNCGEENVSLGNIVYVTPIYICKREENVSEEQGMVLLKERSEISNLVCVIGNVCREPHFYVDANNRNYAQYQLAVNRRYRIHEDADDIRTDYPWIKTFGNQALEDSKCLKVGSSVYISGALQTREIIRNITCEDCSEKYEFPDSVVEIVPYYIGYLSNCLDKKDQGSEEQSETQDLLAQGEITGEEN